MSSPESEILVELDYEAEIFAYKHFREDYPRFTVVSHRLLTIKGDAAFAAYLVEREPEVKRAFTPEEVTDEVLQELSFVERTDVCKWKLRFIAPDINPSHDEETPGAARTGI